MHYYQHHIGDYRRDTGHLSLLEHGVYRQLLDMYYLAELPIPEETEVVCRRLSARTDAEKTAVQTILNEYFYRENGWRHKRCDDEIEVYVAKADNARMNGKLGGRPSKTKVVISGNPEQTDAKANHKPLTINQEPLTIKEKESKALPASRKAKLPDDFYPDSTGLQKAENAKIIVAAELERFADFHKAKGTLMLDWQAAWRTWVSNAVKFARPPTCCIRMPRRVGACASGSFAPRGARARRGSGLRGARHRRLTAGLVVHGQAREFGLRADPVAESDNLRPRRGPGPGHQPIRQWRLQPHARKHLDQVATGQTVRYQRQPRQGDTLPGECCLRDLAGVVEIQPALGLQTLEVVGIEPAAPRQ